MVFLKEFSEKVDLKENSADNEKHENFPSGKRAQGCREQTRQYECLYILEAYIANSLGQSDQGS